YLAGRSDRESSHLCVPGAERNHGERRDLLARLAEGPGEIVAAGPGLRPDLDRLLGSGRREDARHYLRVSHADVRAEGGTRTAAAAPLPQPRRDLLEELLVRRVLEARRPELRLGLCGPFAGLDRAFARGGQHHGHAE